MRGFLGFCWFLFLGQVFAQNEPSSFEIGTASELVDYVQGEKLRADVRPEPLRQDAYRRLASLIEEFTLPHSQVSETLNLQNRLDLIQLMGVLDSENFAWYQQFINRSYASAESAEDFLRLARAILPRRPEWEEQRRLGFMSNVSILMSFAALPSETLDAVLGIFDRSLDELQQAEIMTARLRAIERRDYGLAQSLRRLSLRPPYVGVSDNRLYELALQLAQPSFASFHEAFEHFQRVGSLVEFVHTGIDEWAQDAMNDPELQLEVEEAREAIRAARMNILPEIYQLYLSNLELALFKGAGMEISGETSATSLAEFRRYFESLYGVEKAMEGVEFEFEREKTNLKNRLQKIRDRLVLFSGGLFSEQFFKEISEAVFFLVAQDHQENVRSIARRSMNTQTSDTMKLLSFLTELRFISPEAADLGMQFFQGHMRAFPDRFDAKARRQFLTFQTEYFRHLDLNPQTSGKSPLAALLSLCRRATSASPSR